MSAISERSEHRAYLIGKGNARCGSPKKSSRPSINPPRVVTVVVRTPGVFVVDDYSRTRTTYGRSHQAYGYGPSLGCHKGLRTASGFVAAPKRGIWPTSRETNHGMTGVRRKRDRPAGPAPRHRGYARAEYLSPDARGERIPASGGIGPARCRRRPSLPKSRVASGFPTRSRRHLGLVESVAGLCNRLVISGRRFDPRRDVPRRILDAGTRHEAVQLVFFDADDLGPPSPKLRSGTAHLGADRP